MRLPWGNWVKKVSTQADRTGWTELGDFTANARVIFLALVGVFIGGLSAVVAVALLRLISLCTNLFFFHRWSSVWVSPAANRLGAWVLVVPVIGAILVGFMARFGSERIRGHVPKPLRPS